MSQLTLSSLSPAPVDQALEDVRFFLLDKPDLQTVIGLGLRKAFDEVIDGARTARYCIEELEKTEKTYIGTKVEILLRAELHLQRGVALDNLICGHEVDTKFSLTGGWMIPSEALNHLCLVVEANDNQSIFSVGLLRMTPEVLTPGSNKDGKRSVSAAGRRQVRWLITSASLPQNFLLHLDPNTRDRIMQQSSGVLRMAELFRSVTGRLIPRTAILQVARQQDPLRRAREMKKYLAQEGLVVLCATYQEDQAQFLANGFSSFNSDDWLSLRRS